MGSPISTSRVLTSLHVISDSKALLKWHGVSELHLTMETELK